MQLIEAMHFFAFIKDWIFDSLHVGGISIKKNMVSNDNVSQINCQNCIHFFENFYSLDPPSSEKVIYFATFFKQLLSSPHLKYDIPSSLKLWW